MTAPSIRGVRTVCVLAAGLLGAAACSAGPTASLPTLPGQYVLQRVDDSLLPAPFAPGAPATAVGTLQIVAGAVDIYPSDSLRLTVTVQLVDSAGNRGPTSDETWALRDTLLAPDSVVSIPGGYAAGHLAGSTLQLDVDIPLAPTTGYSALKHSFELLRRS